MDKLAQAYTDPSGATPVRIRDLEALFRNVISVVIGFAGIALFLMLILGGYKYITSGGNPEAAQSASKTLTYAIGGLVLVALAYLILVIIEEFTGAQVTIFRVTL